MSLTKQISKAKRPRALMDLMMTQLIRIRMEAKAKLGNKMKTLMPIKMHQVLKMEMRRSKR